MMTSHAQPPSAIAGTHLVLYDGVCGLCERRLHFLLRHDRHRVFRFASLHSAVGRSIVERSGGNPPVRDRGYDIVATGRYRLFGRYDSCLAPRPEFRSRFID